MTLSMRRTRRTRHGYSLPEILIASALLGLLLIGTLRWVSGLIDVSATHADLTRPRIDGRFVTEQFRSDVGSAQVCEPSGLGGILHHISDDAVALYADDDADGDTDVVWWRYQESNGRLERLVVAGTGDCAFAATPPGTGWSLLADNVVRLDTLPLFEGVGGPAGGYTGVCTGLDAEMCLFDSLRLRAVPTSPATGYPAPIDTSVRLDLTGSRL